jgi:hypothetical protein
VTKFFGEHGGPTGIFHSRPNSFLGAVVFVLGDKNISIYKWLIYFQSANISLFIFILIFIFYLNKSSHLSHFCLIFVKTLYETQRTEFFSRGLLNITVITNIHTVYRVVDLFE